MGRPAKLKPALTAKDSHHVTSHNPGMIMGRAICFAKYAHDNYTLKSYIEPCWKDKNGKFHDSKDVYMEYLKWLKSKP